MFASYKFFSLLALCFLVSSCVTAKKYVVSKMLDRARDTKATKIQYDPPPAPYIKKNKTSVDAFWFHKKNKSSISYFSSCSKEHPHLSLREMEQDVLSSVSYSRRLKTERGIRHLYSVIQTKKYRTTNGVYTLKLKSCFFVFNLISPSLSLFKKEEPVFKKFVQGFKAL